MFFSWYFSLLFPLLNEDSVLLAQERFAVAVKAEVTC